METWTLKDWFPQDDPRELKLALYDECEPVVNLYRLADTLVRS